MDDRRFVWKKNAFDCEVKYINYKRLSAKDSPRVFLCRCSLVTAAAVVYGQAKIVCGEYCCVFVCHVMWNWLFGRVPKHNRAIWQRYVNETKKVRSSVEATGSNGRSYGEQWKIHWRENREKLKISNFWMSVIFCKHLSNQFSLVKLKHTKNKSLSKMSRAHSINYWPFHRVLCYSLAKRTDQMRFVFTFSHSLSFCLCLAMNFMFIV